MIYSIENTGIYNFRQFQKEDYMRGAAQLIYGTDKYIYPYWCSKVADFVDEITPLLQKPGFIFNYQNLYGAFHQTSHGVEMPHGLFAILDSNSQLDFDYSQLKAIDARHRFVIENYIDELLEQRRTMPNRALLGICLNIDPSFRKRGLAEKLMSIALDEKSGQGYNEFYFDCLRDNQAALNLYQKLGCKITGNGIGFDGTEHSSVKIYHLVLNLK